MSGNLGLRTNENMSITIEELAHLSSSDLQQLITAGAFEGIEQNVLQQLVGQGQQPAQVDTVESNFTALQPATVMQASASRQTSRPTSNRTSNRPQTTPDGIWVEIVEQPKQRGLRFRYECEGRSAGSIPGANSSTEKKTFPTIKIHNYTGTAVVVVSCVCKDQPYEPHPHNLVGRDCKRGVCTIKVKDTNVISFPHLGIQCAKKKDVESNLQQRKEINVDPFQNGFKLKTSNIDLNVVRLCFQAFLPDASGKISRIVPPVVSLPIHDKKALNELVICRIDRSSGRAKGGEEVFLLCEKINRDDIQIRFYEEITPDGDVVWEDFGDFSVNDIHRQFAIVFKTPPYKDAYITRPVEVKFQLKRANDNEVSEPVPFTYMPEDPDPDRIHEKKKRKIEHLRNFGFDPSQAVSQDDLKARLKNKAIRSKIKQENDGLDIPGYSFDNLTGNSSTATATMGANNMGASNMPGMSNMGASSMGAVTSTSMSVRSSDNSSMGMVNIAPTDSVRQQLASLPEAQQFEILRQLAMKKLQQDSRDKLINTNTSSGIPVNAQQNIGTYSVGSNPPQMTMSAEPGNGLLADVQMQQGMVNLPSSGQDCVSAAASSAMDLNMVQAYLGDQGTSVSFESIDGLSGDLMMNYDPNIAAMEVIGGSEESRRQTDEVKQALQGLNQTG